MNEQLISLETAKLAKEKGFPQIEDLTAEECSEISTYDINDDWEKPEWKLNYYGEAATRYLSAHSQSLLQKWLREKHKCKVWCQPSNQDNWFAFHAIDAVEILVDQSKSSTYENSLEEGLREGLILIEL